MSTLTYPEAAVIGVLQGVSELFPVSSLGHSVLLPALIGGSWARDLSMSAPNSPYLTVIVAMHVATAIGMVIFFWRDWVRLLGGMVSSIRDREIRTPEQRLFWLLVAGTIPVGIAGLALQKVIQEYLGRPIPTAIFLALNGAVLYGVEWFRSRNDAEDDEYPDLPRVDAPLHLQETTVIPAVSGAPPASAEQTVPIAVVGTEDEQSDRRLSGMKWAEAFWIGVAQCLALFPGISRSGITMVGGLTRGIRHQDAARFAFLLSTPAILGAGLLKLPDLLKPEAHGVIGPALLGSVLAGIGAYLSTRFLTSYFETRTLRPFAWYCVIAGIACLGWFTLA
jgi:undecaprenyl-diphosphatase